MNAVVNWSGVMGTDDPMWRVVGNLEGRFEKIEKLLSEANEQRREFQGSMRTAITELQAIMPIAIEAQKWIDTDGKPAVNSMKRAKHIALGAVGVSAVGSSPAWAGKVAAIFQAIFP